MQDIIEEVDLRKRGVDDPILVHCSAGIGRTGTFLAVHTNLERELKGEKIDVKETVYRLRKQRIGTHLPLRPSTLRTSTLSIS